MSAQIQPPREELAGKVALVTGAASGIGAATALLMAKAGAAVVVADINETGARQTADAIAAAGGRAAACRLDVTSESEWEAAVASMLAQWGGFDILVNNAGVAASGPIESITLSGWRGVMSVNLEGVMLGMRQAMRAMKSAGGGSIINIASAAGIKALPNNSAYGTSKAAVRFLTRVAALEGAPHNIRVNSISPGGVATPIWEGTPLWPIDVAAHEGQAGAMRALVAQGFAEPMDIARVVLFLAGEESKFINGADLPVDAGFSAG